MSYRTVLVHINDIESAPAILNASAMIAAKHDAHLIGLHVITAMDIPVYTGAINLPDSVYEDHLIASEQRAALIHAEFEQRMKREQVSCEWHTIKSLTTLIGNSVVEFSRCADLTIVAQGVKGGADNGQDNLAEQLLMESGRPVLIIPNDTEVRSIGEYPLLAWNASRESARAAFDAVPIFEKAKEVLAVSVDANGSNSNDLTGCEIATSLSRYNVNVKTNIIKPGGERIDEVILSRIKETGADLLVTGGYGRSRFREYVFGGVTRRILKSMPIPVFMSH